MVVLRELALTAAIGLGLGYGLIRINAAFDLSLPVDPGKKMIFLIGILLFSLTFRLFWSLRQEEEKNTNRYGL